MRKLVLHPTTTSAWQHLVKEANQVCHRTLSEDLESYLVFLLMRTTSEPGIAKRIVALEFLESAHKSGKQQSLMRKNVGDNCLIFSGLFPGQARRRRVNISYFVNIGKTAYSTLARRESAEGKLFEQLSDNFTLLMDTMHCMREIDGFSQSLDLLEATELWEDTKSMHAKEVIDKSTNGVFIPQSKSSTPKH